MAVYKVSGKAESDLTKMYEYRIDSFGLKQAQEYPLGIQEFFQILSDNINLGRDASEFVFLLKRFSYKSHIFFYLATNIDVLIVRVINQSMDYENNL